MKLNKPAALVVLFITIVIWGSAYVGIRMGLADGYDPGAMGLLRYLVASLCLVPVYFSVPKRQKLTWKDAGLLWLAGAVGIGVYNISLNFGEREVSAGVAGFIISTMPVVVTVFSVIFLKVRLNLKAWCGIGLALLGLVCIFIAKSSKTEIINWHVLEICLSVFCGALYLMLQKPLLKKFHPLEVVSWAIWLGTLTMCVFLPKLIHQLPHVSWQATAVVVYLGVFPAAIAYAGWSIVLTYFDTHRAASGLFLIPVVAMFFGWLILAEMPPLLAFLGSAFALVGAITLYLQT